MASAYQAMQRALAGTSTDRLYWMGLPTSSVSSSASSSWAARIFSAKRCSTFLRAAGDCPAQRLSSKAWRADATAESMSAAWPRATSARVRPSSGEMQSKVFPAAAATRLPPITARPSGLMVAARARQSGLGVFMSFPPCRAGRALARAGGPGSETYHHGAAQQVVGLSESAILHIQEHCLAGAVQTVLEFEGGVGVVQIAHSQRQRVAVGADLGIARRVGADAVASVACHIAEQPATVFLVVQVVHTDDSFQSRLEFIGGQARQAPPLGVTQVARNWVGRDAGFPLPAIAHLTLQGPVAADEVGVTLNQVDQ